MRHKALVLFSGGLDSSLAAKIMLSQGIDTEAVYFWAGICTRRASNDKEKDMAEDLGLKLHIVDISTEFLNVVRNPSYGYGRNINPCLDCKIFMLRKAKDMMKEIGAYFIVTGEVLGERPMSQRRDALSLIEKQTGLSGYLLRPLSAKHLKPTVPEIEGIVKRDLLFDIKGRSRKPQLALAEKFGIKQYLSPAGGCLLTDPAFSNRIKDLMKHGEFSMPNIELLKVGRHFRINKVKIIVGRNKDENEIISNLATKDDMLFKVKGFPGPTTLARGAVTQDIVELASSLTAGYTKNKDHAYIDVEYWGGNGRQHNAVTVIPRHKEKLGLKSL